MPKRCEVLLMIILPILLCCLYINYGVKKVNIMLITYFRMLMAIISTYYVNPHLQSYNVTHPVSV
jgi:hypothetical protein